MKSSPQHVPALVLAIILALSASGCYTKLRHPEVGYDHNELIHSECAACHDTHHQVELDPSYYRDDWGMPPWWYLYDSETVDTTAPRGIYAPREVQQNTGTTPGALAPVQGRPIDPNAGSLDRAQSEDTVSQPSGTVKPTKRKDDREESDDQSRTRRGVRDRDIRRRTDEDKSEKSKEKDKKEKEDPGSPGKKRKR